MPGSHLQVRRSASQFPRDGRERDRVHPGPRPFQHRCPGLLHRRHGFPGDRAAGARSGPQADPGRHRPARRRHVDQQVGGDLRGPMPTPWKSVARRSSPRASPAGRARGSPFSSASFVARIATARSWRRRRRRPTAGGDRQLHRRRRGRPGSSAGYPPADADRAGQRGNGIASIQAHPPINSYVLQQKLPIAQLIFYPDANHGSFYQLRLPRAVLEARDALPRRVTPVR